MFEETSPKIKDFTKIITFINKNENKDYKVKKMINIYIYKILYNKYQIDVFLNEENIKKFKLETYKNFKGFININEEESFKFDLETINSESIERRNIILYFIMFLIFLYLIY